MVHPDSLAMAASELSTPDLVYLVGQLVADLARRVDPEAKGGTVPPASAPPDTVP